MLNWRLCTSSLNLLGHVSSIIFMAIESTGIDIDPHSLMWKVCHPYKMANYLQQKSFWILGIVRKFLNILWGEPCALPFFFNSCTYHDHILDTSLCPCIRPCWVWSLIIFLVFRGLVSARFGTHTPMGGCEGVWGDLPPHYSCRGVQGFLWKMPCKIL